MQPQLKKIFRVYQSLIIAVVILILFIVGLVVGIIPLAQRSFGLSAEITAVSADVSALQDKAAILQSLDEETLRNNLIVLSSAVPPDKSLMTLLGTVDGVTSKTGVTLVNVALAKPGSLATDSAKKLTVKEAAVGSNVLPFVLSVSGTYEQIRAFVTTIVSVRRFLRIRSMDISLVGPTDVTARVTMDAFYYPFPQAVGALTAQVTALTEKEEQTIQSVSAMEMASGQPISSELGPVDSDLPVGKSDPFSR